MWYLVIAALAAVYLINNLFVPDLGTVGSFLLRPLLLFALGGISYFVADSEGVNILQIRRDRRWNIGETPTQGAIMVGGFYIALLVFIGLISGFGKSPYSFSPLPLLMNIFYVCSLIVGVELTRSYLINRNVRTAKNVTQSIFITTVLFVFFTISLSSITSLSFDRPVAILEFLGISVIVALSVNAFASYICYLGGSAASIGFMSVVLGFEWFSPILPMPHWTILALIGTIAPAIGFLIVENSRVSDRDKKRLSRMNRLRAKQAGGKPDIGWPVIAIIGLILVFFSYGFLGVTPTVIYTGSMSPEIEVGDVVIIDDVEIEDIQLGDIIRYVSFDNQSYTVHRVIAVNQDENGHYEFITQGDANDQPDFKPIGIERVNGIVVGKIPKIGWVQILIRSGIQWLGLPI